MKKLAILFFLAMTFLVHADKHILEIKGDEGPGKGKTIVLVSGDEEYRSEESMPMLAKILAKKHGFRCIVLFAWDPSGTYIDPNNQQGVKGWNYLAEADLMLIGTRFRKPNEADRAHIEKFLNAGKPIIAIRTATHAFNGGDKIGNIPLGKFGPEIVGEGWVNHHGRHKVEGARGVIESANAKHPILNNVKDVFGPSDVYGIRKVTPERDTILMRGQVTKTLDPKSEPVEKKNNPMQPLAWLHEYKSPSGAKGMTFATTMGASVDLVSEDLRRMLVNATYHLLKLDVPEKADVAYVDPWYPSFYGFIRDKSYWKNQDMQAEDYGLGKTPAAADVKGSPKWEFRPMKK